MAAYSTRPTWSWAQVSVISAWIRLPFDSYSDAGADGSLLAHGTVDNFVVTVPPPPVQNLTGNFTHGVWQTQFLSQSNWFYALQRSADFQSWLNISSATPGNATNLVLQDTNPPPAVAFYRISAQRP